MPDSRSAPPAGPRAALDALLAAAAGDTLRRAHWLDAVDRLLRPHLPPELAAHARLANVRGNRLVFLVDSPVWHARLRLATPVLLDAARSIGLEVTDMGVRTTTQPLRPVPAPATPHASMSAASRSGLATAMELLRSATPEEEPGTAAGRKARSR
ncbi:MAG: DUF721 domain-containing protein [Thermomonas sp.]|uniref:DUF721 domain-containing protein n=1 Tax=Thermomonas sp. TaxID=1971895 RepID=UPI0039E40406